MAFWDLVSLFQLTAARRRLASPILSHARISGFQLTAARRRLAFRAFNHVTREYVSTHSRPKAAGRWDIDGDGKVKVSTHSRPKAAGSAKGKQHKIKASFNSQPPEGGWMLLRIAVLQFHRFNSQPPEGGW